jgi:hypothetical protein
MQQNLTVSAQVAGNKELTQENLDTWNFANGMDFNSIFITD